ncbi:MAG: alpha-amylase family protein [Xanthobacteraceae bacterium]
MRIYSVPEARLGPLRGRRSEFLGRAALVWFCATLLAASTMIAGSGSLTAQEAASLTAPWLRQARVAGARVFADMSASTIERDLAALAAQNVSVVEADSSLSDFLTEAEFEAELRFMRQYVRTAHRLGLKVVWYVATLEVLSVQAARGDNIVSKAHPDWLQRGLDGKPNVYVGEPPGTLGSVHWVDPGSESAWMSIHSGYVDVFLDRIKRIAATGLDGIWLDVPLYSEMGASWPDAGPQAAAKFLADTGMQVPRAVDWNDPVWRRWIAWRYREITNFLLRVRDAARSVSSGISIVVETVTLDYGLATLVGLDGSLLKDAPGIIQAWEVDAVSDETAMREAQPDDWISLIGMAKFARGASGSKPSWMFIYGDRPDDSLLVMAEALAAGNNPFETKIPKMTTTVGAAFRRQAYGWIKQQEGRLFASRSGAKVAVYFSPESRDYLDRAIGTGLYTVIRDDDASWWSNEPNDSLYLRTYLAEYRGVIKWLVNNHVPFDIVVRPQADELSAYDAVIAPSPAALSDGDAATLDRYVANGGHLVVTGPDAAMLDGFGSRRAAPILQSLNAGARTAMHSPRWLGKEYLASNSAEAGAAIGEMLGAKSRQTLQTDAGPNVHVAIRTLGDEMLVHLVNPERLWDKTAPEQREVSISLALPAGHRVKDVQITSPVASQKPAQAAVRLPFSVNADRVVFKVPLRAYAMVVVTTQP